MANLADFVKSVRVILDENQISNSILDAIYSDQTDANSDQLKIDELIKEHIPGALRYVHTNASTELLGSGTIWPEGFVLAEGGWSLTYPSSVTNRYMSSETIANKMLSFLKVKLPTKFLRIVAAKLKSWEIPVTDVLSADDPRYKEQFSRYASVRASSETPMAFLVPGPGFKAIHMFPAKTKEQQGVPAYDDVLEYMSIIQDIDSSDITDSTDVGTLVDARLMPSLRYTVASFVCTSLDDHDRAAKFLEIATSMMIVDKNK